MSDFEEEKHPRGEAGKFSTIGVSPKARAEGAKKALEKLAQARAKQVPPVARSAAVSLLRDAGSLTEAIAAAKDYEGTVIDPESGDDANIEDVRAALEALKPPPLPEGEEMVTVHHATNSKTAETMLKDGIIPELKGETLASMQYAKGEDATFAPGKGLSRGIYVAEEGKAESYDRVVLELRVPKSYLEVSPEQHTLGVKDAVESLRTHDGAVITKGIPPSAVKRVRG